MTPPVYHDLRKARDSLLAGRGEAVFDPELSASVAEIVADVREHGDEALVRALERFDGVHSTPDELRVGADELAAASDAVPAELAEAIRTGIENIRRFNGRILRDASWREEIEPGLLVGEQAKPIASAGLFVPSGKGSFPSVLMHLGTPAVVAGVKEVTVIVPPQVGSGEVDPAVLFVASALGLEQVFRSNGPAGIAALAFGTESIPRVARVVGPGSPAVAVAQMQVQSTGCSTVLLFGPSESLIVADESADPGLLAADLVTEAEHGPDSAALLVTPSEDLAVTVRAGAARLAAELPEPRRGWAEQALSRGGIVVVASLEEAVAFANDYAPEHLQLAVRDPESLVPSVEHAGEILLGQVPFAAANYLLGVPNTLPTGGFARVNSGVTARTFLKTSSTASASEPALGALTAESMAIAQHEGFPAHSRALMLRARGRPATVPLEVTDG